MTAPDAPSPARGERERDQTVNREDGDGVSYDEDKARMIEEIKLLRRALDRTNRLAAQMSLAQLRERYGDDHAR